MGQQSNKVQKTPSPSRLQEAAEGQDQDRRRRHRQVVAICRDRQLKACRASAFRHERALPGRRRPQRHLRWPDLRRRCTTSNRAAARKALPTALQVLHDTHHWRVTLVLDGTHGSAPFSLVAILNRHGNSVYATADQTADSIIERLVAGSGRAPRITRGDRPTRWSAVGGIASALQPLRPIVAASRKWP